MIIYPAIDLRGGQVVRLQQGDFNQETIYSCDPLSIAQKFASEGARWLHVVDLDGARNGCEMNSDIVAEIKRSTELKVQLGGGIRSLEAIEDKLSRGIDRLVVGTLAWQNPKIIARAVQRFGGDRLAVGIDARGGRVSTHGWLKESSRQVLEFARQMLELGIKRLIYTDIGRDGMLSGPDFPTLKAFVGFKQAEIIASGGVSSYTDLLRLKELGVGGAIIGQALYQGVLELPEIWERLGDEGC